VHHPHVTALRNDLPANLHADIALDRLDGELEPLRQFILPGGHAAAAAVHLARAVCRRAERRMVGLGVEAVGPTPLVYINRLSDLLFTLARAVNARTGVKEQEW